MIFKLLTLPFRFNWVVTLVIALGIGYWAYSQFQTFEQKWTDADVQVADGAPDPVPLSKWNAATDVGLNNEVNVQGIYFTALQTGRIDPTGSERQFIMLADDQGREVKAVLVVPLDDLSQLLRQLSQQGSGDRIPVTVNGMLNQQTQWRDLIRTELAEMQVPSANDLVVIEPYIGSRASAVYTTAENTLIKVIALSGLAALLGFVAFIKMLLAMVRGRRSSATQSQMSGRDAKVARQQKRPTQKAVPIGNASDVSPWGKFQPQDRSSNASDSPAAKSNRMVKPQTGVPAKSVIKGQVKPQSKSQATSAKTTVRTDKPLASDFKSVFPMGGSGFRFKSADQIIRQSFGTLSSLAPSKHED